jgi:glutathione S-transferase
MAAIKLWYSPGACSLASHILLKETDVDFEAAMVDIHNGIPEEFSIINPKLRIPVLSIDGQVITESPAILTAISQLSPEKHLMGQTSLEIVREYEWLNWLSGTLHAQAFGGLFRAHRFSDDPSTYESIRSKSLKTVEECFDMIEQGLSSAHAVGDSITAVDAFLYVFFRWGASLGMGMTEKYPNFTNLVVELAKRQSVQEALNIEGVESYVPML